MDIDSICRLNRLRDKREKRNGIDFVAEKGLIDEMIRQSYYYIEKNGELATYCLEKNIIISGAYINSEKNSNGVWDNYFSSCENVYKSGWIKNTDYESKLSEGRLIGIELLIDLAEGKLNKNLKNNFDIEVNSIDDFKDILKDDEKGKIVCKYLLGIIKKYPKVLAQKGKHEEYYIRRTQKQNKTICVNEPIFNYSIDKKLEDDEKEEKEDFLKILGTEDNHTIDNRNDTDSIYKFINDKKDSIFTEKQLLFLEKLSNNETDVDERYNYKKYMTKAIEETLNNCKYVEKTVYGYSYKKDIIEILENILCQDNITSFKNLCKYLRNVQNKSINIIEDIIFQLDPIYYKPIIKYINTQELDKDYIENNYQIVYDRLQKEYQFQAYNLIKLYNYNTLKDQEINLKMINYIENNIMKGLNKAFIPSSELESYTSMPELKKYYSSLIDRNTSYNNLILKLKELGYIIEKERSKKKIKGEIRRGKYITRKNIPF